MLLDGKFYTDSTLTKDQGLKIIRKKIMHGFFLIYRYWRPFFLKVYAEYTKTNANISC